MLRSQFYIFSFEYKWVEFFENGDKYTKDLSQINMFKVTLTDDANGFYINPRICCIRYIHVRPRSVAYRETANDVTTGIYFHPIILRDKVFAILPSQSRAASN